MVQCINSRILNLHEKSSHTHILFSNVSYEIVNCVVALCFAVFCRTLNFYSNVLHDIEYSIYIEDSGI